MEIPEIHYARNGGIALAYQVVGDGPIDLVFLPAFISNIEIAWESPAYARFLRRLASFSRVISWTGVGPVSPIACLPKISRRWKS